MLFASNWTVVLRNISTGFRNVSIWLRLRELVFGMQQNGTTKLTLKIASQRAIRFEANENKLLLPRKLNDARF